MTEESLEQGKKGQAQGNKVKGGVFTGDQSRKNVQSRDLDKG